MKFKYTITKQDFDAVFDAAKIPRRYKMFEIDETNQGWMEKFRFVQNSLETGCLFALVGGGGTGKTQMAVEIIREMCVRGKSSLYTSAMDVFLAIRETYDNKNLSERGVMGLFRKPRLLVIDETQERSENAWENRLLTWIIDKRYGDMKDTILIANQKPGELESSLGASIVSRMIVSRMNETGGIIDCSWGSFRN